MKNVCVFTGAKPGNRQVYAETAYALGRLVADCKLGLVYGGGSNGLMGRVADGAVDAGGHVTGIIPDFLDSQEIAHDRIHKLHVIETMHERKDLMYGMSDIFLILPGGLGTLDEAMEVSTWRQLKLHDKRVVFINIEGYWNDLHSMLRRVIDEGFMHHEHLQHFEVVETLDEVAGLLKRLQAA